MTGEEEAWLRLSLRLHKTPSEIMHQVSYPDFLRYAAIMEKEVNEPSKSDWYMAQLCYEVWCVPLRVWGKTPPPSITVKNFLMKFGAEDRESREVINAETEEAAVEAYSQRQMIYWATAMGMPLPGQTFEDDGSPVMTQLPPDMRGMTVKAQEATTFHVTPPVLNNPPTDTAPAPAGFNPSGRRRSRGH